VLEERPILSSDIETLKAQMTAIIVRDAEHCFDDPGERENLQITVRIACEFLMFLQQSENMPESREAQYTVGTIRSGLDWFFSMAQTGRILTGLNLENGFGPKLPNTFSELKESYRSIFKRLLEATHSAEAVGLLLSLVQMMLLFMAAYFPSFRSFSLTGDHG